MSEVPIRIESAGEVRWATAPEEDVAINEELARRHELGLADCQADPTPQRSPSTAESENLLEQH